MVRTQSATPLDAVLVAPIAGGGASEIWLRRNIEHDVIEHPEGTQDVWEADEAHGVLPGRPSAAYVEARFAQLWASFEEADLTDRELVELRADTLGGGLAEVADLAAENAESYEVLATAFAEFVEEMVGGEQ